MDNPHDTGAGLSRRELLLAAAAASVPLLSAASAAAQPGPIAKPLAPEWFVDHGTNAEMRWDPARR